jgi:nanoRNase/pAp phosphatase (c-di-AMP/oligoRNAs hydrolase)
VVGLSLLGADAGAGHLEDDGVVDEAIDRGGGGHRVVGSSRVPSSEAERAINEIVEAVTEPAV